MVTRTRELEASLGSGIKIVEDNEGETVVLQRRALCAKRPLKSGEVLSQDNIFPLRPIPSDGIPPYKIEEVIGKKITKDMTKGEYFKWIDLE